MRDTARPPAGHPAPETWRDPHALTLLGHFHRVSDPGRALAHDREALRHRPRLAEAHYGMAVPAARAAAGR